MFKHGFPPEWSTIKKLIWLVGSGIAGAASSVWKTVTGTLIHLTDALASPMQKCEVTLEPIQDLNGQDAPYPAGGGSNKWNEEWEVGAYDPTTGNKISSSTQIRSKDKTPVIGGASYCFVCVSARISQIYWYDANGDYLSNTSNQSSSAFVTSAPADASFVTFQTPSAYGTSYKNDIAVNYPSTVSTYSPYSNICPITGWTGCEVNVTGNQLFNKATATLGVRLDNNGIEVPDANYFTSSFIRTELNSSYVKNSPTADAYHRFAKYSADKSFVSVQNGNLLSTYTDIYYVKFCGLISEINTAQLEKGTTPTEYESFGTTLSVTFDKNNLPSEYQEVEYIESTGTQYIDTGIECTSDLVVEFKAKCSLAENTALCGGINSSNSPVLFRHHFTPYNDNVYWIQNDSSNNAAIGHSGVSTSDIVMSVDPTNGTAVINGANKTFTALPNNLTTGKSYGLFGRIPNSGVIQTRAGRIYYFKFYRNSQLIGDFVPCFRKSDNVIGMYDKVTESFFTNDGTGEFLKGDYKAVYGGTVDLVSGVLTVDRAKIVLDGTQSIQVANWLTRPNSSAWIYNYNVTKHKYPSVSDVAPNIICESLPALSYVQIQQDKIGVSCYSGTGFGMVIRINDPTLTTKALINAYLVQNPITVVYELAEPIEIQLTPQEISTLKGVNNVWGDGNIELTYKAQAE